MLLGEETKRLKRMVGTLFSVAERVLSTWSSLVHYGCQHLLCKRACSSDFLLKIMSQPSNYQLKIIHDSPDAMESEKDYLAKLNCGMEDFEELRSQQCMESMFTEFQSAVDKFLGNT